MFKRILAVMFCVVMFAGIISAAPAIDSADNDGIKGKIGLAFTTASTASARMWLTNSLGLEMSAKLGIVGNGPFSLGVGANIVFPMMEGENAALYLMPGMSIGFTSSAALGSDIAFNFNVGLQAEAFVIKNLLSVGGTLGMNIGIDVVSPPSPAPSTTSFVMDVGTSPSSLFIRVYI